MILAGMVRRDEAALICDFAQYYHQPDYRGYPLSTAATLAVGLPEDSRIKRKLSGVMLPMNNLLLCAIVDRLNLLLWAQSKDAKSGRNRPVSLLAESFENKESSLRFASGEDFEKERQRRIQELERSG